MYDLEEVRPATDALWGEIATELRRCGVDAPDDLRHDLDAPGSWHRPDLLLGQACGWPLVTGLADEVRVVGAFAYRIDVAIGPTYRSAFVTNVDEARLGTPLPDLRAAVNSFDSLSGWVSLAGPSGHWPGGTVVTGSHMSSLAAVRSGAASVASIDAVTLELVRQWRPQLLHGLAVAGHGPRLPCLPLITRGATDDTTLRLVRSAIGAALQRPVGRAAADVLLIADFHPVGLDHYRRLTALRGSALSPSRPARG